MQHLTTLFDLNRDQVAEILTLTADLKSRLRAGQRPPLLAGRTLTQVFEKPSLRTRASFEAAMQQVGGGSLFLSAKDAGLEGREAKADIARVLGSYSDVIVLRTYSQEVIETFSRHAGCPVINGLSDVSHPCQALTDLFTMQEELGPLAGRKLAYVGDGNNVAVSLAEACAIFDVTLAIGAPAGYQLPEDFLDSVRHRYPQAQITQHSDPAVAVRGADVVYTDVWASMGQESEKEARARIFAPYQVNAALMAAAGPDSRFMHCLPARRGLEVTDDVLDGPRSVAFAQAENRMHLAKGVLVWLLRERT